LESDNIDRAVDAFEEAVRLHPKSPRAYVRLAQLQTSQGNLELARDTLEKGIEETNRSAYLVLQWAQLLEQVGDTEAAVSAYEEVLTRFADATIAANNLAMLLATKVSSAAALDRALELARPFADSEVPELLDTIGWVHYLRGEHEQALQYLEKAVAGRPDSIELRYHLGMNLAKVGRYAEARQHLTVASNAEKFDSREEATRALERLSRGGS
jgi:tetratricopeptide (TPR) repeat protein